MYAKALLFGILLCFSALSAHAGVGPFGLSVGTTSLDEARAQLSAQTRLEALGENRWTNGPMFKSSGAGLGLNGLQEALFIFDTDATLAGVILYLNKNRYQDFKGMLSEQYQLISDQAPFVGNQLATFRQDDVTIEAEAPHMSFQMEIRYLHRSLIEAYNQGSQREQQEQRRQESSQL